MPTQTAIASTSVTTSSKYLYCYCKEDIGQEMVGCDNGKRPHGSWFHLYCLKLNVYHDPQSGIAQTVEHCHNLAENDQKSQKHLFQ